MKLKLSLAARRSLEGFGFIMPWLIGFFVFMAFPLAYSLYMSFTEVQVTATSINFTYVGWANYVHAFLGDNVFPIELMAFIQESLISVPIIVIFSLLVGLLINEDVWGRSIFRAIFFLPVIFSTSQVITTLFDLGAGGGSFIQRFNVFNMLINALPESLNSPVSVVLSRFTLVLWSSGVQILLILAALKTISNTVYEAAAIDGAGRWEAFWKITLPALRPFIVLTTVYTIVELSVSPFNRMLTVINNNMFSVRTGMGYAAALGWIYFALILVALVVVYTVGMRKVYRY
ncbi:MAG TPA: sugar ABC transporter permease [Firmicutes bacterium]|nr:sugar ABC transporter permease [Bacillota bacterium]